MDHSIRNEIDTYLSDAEIATLKQRSDWQGVRALVQSWAIIAACLALAAWQPHPLVIVAAIVLIGGQQLALAVSMHEAAHHLMFKTRWANDWAGRWLAAYPVIQDIDRKRTRLNSSHV